MSKLTDYPAVTRFDSGDILVKDGAGGTKTIAVRDAAIELAGLISPESHRNVYRGKNLGGAVTSDQKAAIQNGTFDDLFIGDYWRIGENTYRIADMDYWYNCGDNAFNKHHLVMVPDQSIYNAQMNDTNTTSGGYIGSKMYRENLTRAKTIITSAFDGMLLTHRAYLTNAVSNGAPSAGAWLDSNVELMNEVMVYGCHVYAPMSNGVSIPNQYSLDKHQLSLFTLNPKMVDRRYTYWLIDVVSETGFAVVHAVGFPDRSGASNSLGVRPVFAIG